MVNTRTDAELAAAVQAAVDAMLPQIREQVREEYRTGAVPSGSNPPPVTIHTWLERFNKQKPRSFEKAVAPVDAENWISHIEKIFDVMDCNDVFKTRLAVYKFEGDALAWWKAYKHSKARRWWVLYLTGSFQRAVLSSVFPSSRTRALEERAVGTAEEQAKNFRWGLHKSILDHVMCIQFSDVLQLRKNSGPGLDQRNRRSAIHHRSTNPGYHDVQVLMELAQCGQARSFCQRDCKKNTVASLSGHADKKPEHQACLCTYPQDQARQSSAAHRAMIDCHSRRVIFGDIMSSEFYLSLVQYQETYEDHFALKHVTLQSRMALKVFWYHS
ncbi:hypothetical protein Tco_0045869 [Tanacetum coccineum]